MPFYIRRSVHFGPFRLNFSKSGVGVSTGVRGARIGTGPRGAYVHLGRGGLYYRQHLGTPNGRPLALPAPISMEIPTADVAQLTDSSAEDMLAAINFRIKHARRWALVAGVFTVVLALALVGVVPGLAGVVVVLGLAAALALWTGDHERRTTVVHYDLDEDAVQRFADLTALCTTLARSECIWRVRSTQHTDDWKRNAGANQLIGRKRVSLGTIDPPFLRTNVTVFGIAAGGTQLLFFPDRLLVYQDGAYGAVEYGALVTSFQTADFREDGYVPRDASIVGQTWQFVRRSDGPDRRFANNRQVRIVNYGEIRLGSLTGLRIVLQVSDHRLAREFTTGFDHWRSKLDRSASPTVPPLTAQSVEPEGNDYVAKVIVGPEGLDPARRVAFRCPGCGTTVTITVADSIHHRTVPCTNCGAQLDLNYRAGTMVKPTASIGLGNVEKPGSEVEEPRSSMDERNEIGAVDRSASDVEVLMQVLQRGAASEREAAARRLGEARDPRAVDALITSLDDANLLVALRAAIALGQIGDSRAAPSLAAAMYSLGPSPELAVALACVGGTAVVEPLLWFSRSNHDPQAAAAVLAAADGSSRFTAEERARLATILVQR